MVNWSRTQAELQKWSADRICIPFPESLRYTKMSFYSTYDNLYVTNKPYSAYDANFLAPNPTMQTAVLDEQAQYDNEIHWKSMGGYFDVAGQEENLFTTQQKVFATAGAWPPKNPPFDQDYGVTWDQWV